MPLNSDKNNMYFKLQPTCIYHKNLAEFFLEWEMFERKDAACEIMCKNIVGPDRPQMTI